MSYTSSLGFSKTNIPTQATGAHAVTLRTPPKGELFADFHKQPSDGAKDTEITSIMPTAFLWQQLMPFMMPGMFQAMTAAVGAPATPSVPEKQCMAPPSSDPVEQDDIQYHSIQEFLYDLGEKHPQ
jgi:hypothetical protein